MFTRSRAMPRHNPQVTVSIDTANRAAVLARRDALVASYMPRVREIAATIKRNLPPSFELDDLISTGYVGLLAAATTYKHVHRIGHAAPVPFEAHAYRIVHGRILDSVRRGRYRDATNSPLEHAKERATPPGGGEGTIDEARLRVRIAAAIAELPPRLRELMGLYYTDDLRFTDIGRSFRVSPGRISHMHTAAIRAIRKLLAA